MLPSDPDRLSRAKVVRWQLPTSAHGDCCFIGQFASQIETQLPSGGTRLFGILD